jgi:hypothetical protein
MQNILDKNVLFGALAFLTVTLAAVLFTTQDAIGDADQVPFSKLTDADIDMIMAVKEEMAAAREVRMAKLQ